MILEKNKMLKKSVVIANRHQTSISIEPEFWNELVDIAKEKWHNIDCNVVPIVNDYFGHQITVAGLLTATDLINQLKGKPLGDRLLLPSSMFRSEGDITLDDFSCEDIEQALGVKVVQVSSDGFELLNAILDV